MMTEVGLPGHRGGAWSGVAGAGRYIVRESFLEGVVPET